MVRLAQAWPLSAPICAKVEIIWKEKHASQVWGWQKPTGVFWCDMTDVNGPWNPDWMRWTMFDYAMLAKQHRHMFLTKRPEKWLSDFNSDYRRDMEAMLYNIMDGVKAGGKKHDEIIGLIHDIQDGRDLFQENNILWGVTIGHQEDMDKFAPTMKELKRLKPNMRLVVSYEPAHGFVDWSPLAGLIDWLIAGGESEQEPNKPLVEYDPVWGVAARIWCDLNGVAFYNKQMGTIWARKHHSASRKGDIMAEWPQALQVHQFPSFEVNP